MTQAGEVHSRKQSIAVPAAPVTQLTTSPITRGIPNVSGANIAAKVPAVDKMREADPNPRLQSRPESDFAQPRTPLKAVCNPSHKVDPEPSRILCRVFSGEKTGFKPRKCPVEVRLTGSRDPRKLLAAAMCQGERCLYQTLPFRHRQNTRHPGQPNRERFLAALAVFG